MIKTFFGILGIGILLIFGIVGVRIYQFAVYPSPKVETPIVIESGTSLREICQTLTGKNVIRDPYLFEIWTRFKGLGNRIQAGYYVFPPDQKFDQVLKLLLKGYLPENQLVIPEGFTLLQVEEKVRAVMGEEKAAEFSKLTHDVEWLKGQGIVAPHAEGYLFPDTYAVDPHTSIKELLRDMMANFHRRVDPLWAQVETSPLSTLYEVLTLVSIVEKEAKVDSERTLIASVYLNRLKLGMPLQADPTVIYGIPNFNGNLTRKNLETDGPYNTYMRVGLPPTPICNSGVASIQAVLQPVKEDFLYFVAKKDGTHEFSKTLAEHNEAVGKYQLRGEN